MTATGLRTEQPSNQGEAATALLAADGEFNAALELAEKLGQVGHWRLALPDYAITWSAEVYRIYGVAAEHYTPDVESAIGFYHPQDRDAIRTAVALAARDGTAFELALRLIRADGELRHVKSRGVSIAGPDGMPRLIFGVLIDVTEQRRIEIELREMNDELERIAYMDGLTKLANRRQFDQTLEREWRRAIRGQTALSLVMLDIDRFKNFNDLYGHVAGDACLGAVAAAITAVLQRPGDMAARYGGEEFALILPATDAAGADTVARAVLRAIAALGLIHRGNPSCGGVVTVSLGISTAYPQPGTVATPWIDLIAEADMLLYEAKRTGRNRMVSHASLRATGVALLPANETERLKALLAYEQAGATGRTADLDRIARLAATLTCSPIGLVSLVGRNEQSFIGNFGLEGVDGTGRDVSFCAHTIMGDDPFVVPDATLDLRFERNALVTGSLGLRYYAGAPIISETTGHRLGAICILDTSARAETGVAERALLTDLAKMVATLIEEKVRSPDQDRSTGLDTPPGLQAVSHA